MTSAEDQELMARIAQVAGQINRHKAQQNGAGGTREARGSYHRVSPYPRAGYRGRGGSYPTYRNRSLVLNGQSRTPTTSTANETSSSSENTRAPGASWVTKHDRHLQLINSTVYEKESQNRTQAIEQTQRRKQLQRDQKEKSKFLTHLQHSGNFTNVGSSSTSSSAKYEIEVDGIRFHITKQGSKLVRSPDDLNPPSATPKVANIGGVKFHRTKNGNLVRHGVAAAHRLAVGIKKVNEPCRAFSWTGSCPKGPQCRYLHDATKVAICREWLLKSDCPNGDACDLSHEPTEERTPLCMHFAKGNCNNPSCVYVHAEHSQADPVCRAFGFYGYCEKGAHCSDRHVFECPDYSNTGVCKTKGCKLLHRDRANNLRKAGKLEQADGEEMDDLSSDDDDHYTGNSDDIDSDEVEEFIGADETDDLDFAAQKDFIQI